MQEHGFIRTKTFNGLSYYYLCESHRNEDGKSRQQVIAYLGKHPSKLAARRHAEEILGEPLNTQRRRKKK